MDRGCRRQLESTCSKDTRLTENGINEAVRTFLSEIQTGAPVLLELHAFLIENVPSYVKKVILNRYYSQHHSLQTCESGKDEVDQKTEDVTKRTRWTIYSHHIYNQTKRRAIQQEARENNLVGFCLAGKPGVIVVEGELAKGFYSRSSFHYKASMMRVENSGR